MLCPKCGTENKEGSSWCNLCQEPLAGSSEASSLERPQAHLETPLKVAEVDSVGLTMIALSKQASSRPNRRCKKYIEELGEIGDFRATDLLLSLATHKQLKLSVFRALAKIGDPKAESFMLLFVAENWNEHNLGMLKVYEERSLLKGGRPEFHVSRINEKYFNEAGRERIEIRYKLYKCRGDLTLFDRETMPWYELQ
jgi:hypothetical protein